MLEQLDRLSVLPAVSGRLRDFLLAASKPLAPLLPPAAEEWLQVAEQYRRKQATVADLERVRVAAWDYLGKDACNFDSPNVLAVRAVLCLLYPDGDDSGDQWFDTIHFFLEVSNRVADRQQDQGKLLRGLFPEYFGGDEHSR